MWTRGRFNQEYLPGLFALAIDSFEKRRAMSQWNKLVTVKSSKKAKEEDVLRSGLGHLQIRGEGQGLAYDTQIAGPKQTWVHDGKALAVRISEYAIEDNLYELKGGSDGPLKELFHDLGESAEDTVEVDMAKFMNSGSATTYHQTRFSKALFATDHKRLDLSTYSNKATSSDLTFSTFWSAIVAAENQSNHRQMKITQEVKNLWVPPQKERHALEILKSTDRPDTANRATNAYAQSGRNIKLIKWSQITDEDMWVLQKEGQGIVFYWRQKPRFARDKDFETGDVMVKVDTRYSAEIQDEQCFYGVIPA